MTILYEDEKFDSLDLTAMESEVDLLQDDFGGRPARQARTPEKVSRFMETYIGFIEGNRRAEQRLIETLSTSDFPYLFGDTLSRLLLGYYSELPAVWDQYVRRRPGGAADFRTLKSLYLNGGGGLLDKVKELAGYPEAKLSDGQYTYKVDKFGRIIRLSLEDITNDDLGALAEIPERMARRARQSEQRFITSLMVGAGGPNTNFFKASNANLVKNAYGAASDNPALSIVGLQDAHTVLSRQVDEEGLPITLDGEVLVVPTSLEIMANNIVHATEITIGADSAAQRILTRNWANGRISVVVDPWLSAIDQATGLTAWYLFAKPGGRPAAEVSFLRGHEKPELFMKAPDAIRLSGSGNDSVSFETDEIAYKVRHIFGGALMDGKAAVVSLGNGAA